MADVLAILDAYKIQKAHVVGHSMGGTITQLLAIHHPDRLLTLTSISVATVGEVTAPPPEVMSLLLENRPTQNFEESLPGFMKSWQLLNGDLEVDLQMAEEYTRELFERSKHPVGAAWNHIRCQGKRGDLSDKLSTVTVPALFIHGEKDLLIPVQGVLNTARATPHATFTVILRMGHMIFDQGLQKQIADLLLRHFQKNGFSPLKNAS